MDEPSSYECIFQSPFPEEIERFWVLANEVADSFDIPLSAAISSLGVVVFRAQFQGVGQQAEEGGRAFWLELHGRCLDANLALELVEGVAAPAAWHPAEEAMAMWREQRALAPLPRQGEEKRPAAPLVAQRPEITTETLYDVLRGDDPEMDKNIAATIAWIDAEGLPVLNLLSYLELPLFQDYAAGHDDEREQNLFLHMLQTWTCYRYFGEVHAAISAELAEAFADPRFLRLSSNHFQVPAPALCLQLPQWRFLIRGPRLQWAKEIYLTFFPAPNPTEYSELTLMIVSHDQNGEFGFIPLEVPLCRMGVGESIDAFFEPGIEDSELGGNSEDLRRLTEIAATYCLYATAADRTPYLPAR